MKVQSTDLIIRCVPGYGFLPIIVKDNEELYRGEFCHSEVEALLCCIHRLDETEATNG